MRDSSLTDSQEHRVARGGRVHGIGLGTLRAYSISVMLGSRYVHEISKLRHRPTEFEDPALVFKIQSDAYKIATPFDYSVTVGGVGGKPRAARPVSGLVILHSVVLKI
jgi:hypothetical protein